MIRVILCALLVSQIALADSARALTVGGKRLHIGTSGKILATANTGTDPAAFVLSTTFELGQVSQLPVCIGDTDCVALCQVRNDLSWQCYDNTGALMSGMTQGVGMTYVPSYFWAADGGFIQSMNYIDDTSSAAAIPRIDNAAIRAAFAGDHTLIAAGYGGTVVNSNGGWWAMITDGTNSMQMRAGGSQFEFIENGMGSAEATTDPATNGWDVVVLRRNGTTVTGRTGGVNGAGVSGSTMTTPTGSAAFFFGGGTGGCCTPGGGLGGPMPWFAIYKADKGQAWVEQTEKNWYAFAGQSGGNGTTGNGIGRLMGRNNLDAGVIPVFSGQGSYITDPVLGVRFQAATQNYCVGDPLEASTWTDVGTPVVTSNTFPGPFFHWKNVNKGDLITTSNAASLDGKRFGSVTGLDGGQCLWVNAACILEQGTAGVTRNQATIRINTNGVLDGGALTCAVSGLASGVSDYYPLGDGCPAFICGASSITADLLVGTSVGQTGSVRVSQCQLSPTPFIDFPMLNSTGSGANWDELDGGGVPYGSAKGKVEVVFQMMYPTSLLAPNYLAKGSVSGTSFYGYDIYGSGASHDVLFDVSVDQTYDGGTMGVPDIQALMYGASSTYENRFDVGPIQFDARQFYVESYEWRPEPGTIPLADGGTTLGVGCRGIARLDPCSDPLTCHASTIVGQNVAGNPIPNSPLLPNGQNSGNLGTCPAASSIIDLGTRIAGSSPTTGWVRSIRIYH